MKRLLTERNIAAFLFVLVIVAFSLAHEDSKKRSPNYNVSTRYLSPDKQVPAISANAAGEKEVVKGN